MDILKLQEYNKKTSNGECIMPDEEVFIEKLKMVTSLYPQRNENGINYLFGGSFGTEIALMGAAASYELNKPTMYSYMPHSSFDICNTNEVDPLIRQVFGYQTAIKPGRLFNISNLPLDFLNNNYSSVLLYDNYYLVPKLELLFLDQILSNTPSKRDDVFDYELLFSKYDLDIEYMINFIKKYCIEKYLNKDYLNELANKQVEYLLNIVMFAEKRVYENDDDFDITSINDAANFLLKSNLFEGKVSSWKCIEAAYCPTSIEFIQDNEDYKLSEKTLLDINTLVFKFAQDRISYYNSIISKIMELHQKKEVLSV